MAAPTPAEFTARFPEFANQAEPVIEGYIATADRATPESVWETQHNDGVCLLTAHLLATRVMQIGNQVGSEAGKPFGEQLAASLYGQEYDRLRKTLPVFGITL